VADAGRLMELGPLKLFLQKKKFTYLEIVEMARDIARGMKHLHIDGVVHRQIEARNILVDEIKNGFVYKISGFSLSRILLNDSKGKTVNLGSSLKWMAPETIKEQAYSRKSDIWSYGCLLFEILSGGQDPFPSLGPSQAAAKVMKGEIRPMSPEGCPAKISSLLTACCSYVPEKRPDVQVILDTLEEVEKDIKSNPFY